MYLTKKINLENFQQINLFQRINGINIQLSPMQHPRAQNCMILQNKLFSDQIIEEEKIDKSSTDGSQINVNDRAREITADQIVS